VGHRAPSLLGRLRKITLLKLLFSVSEKPFARIRMVRYLGLCQPFLLMPALPHRPLKTDTQQLLCLHGELER
jgi:hypothetical protein